MFLSAKNNMRGVYYHHGLNSIVFETTSKQSEKQWRFYPCQLPRLTKFGLGY
jgi:hypothetical protein